MLASTKSRVADTIAEAVAGSGLRFAFGHPGGEVAVLIDALEQAGLRFVLTHHETAAAFMAGGYGELTGRPGLCLATLGPGATNMVTGVASAFLDRAPLLAFTASQARSALPGKTHQALDLNALYGPVTKRSVSLTQENARQVVEWALVEAIRERPGPIHLSLPADVAASPRAAREDRTHVDARSAEADGDVKRLEGPLAAAGQLLATARRPAVIAGIGALRANASAALVDLARNLAASVAVTPKAKGIIAEDDPLFVGVLEMAGDDLVVDFLSGADLLIAVGLDVVELEKPWRLECPIIHVDYIANVDRYYTATVELVGPIATMLERLVAHSPARGGWPPMVLDRHRASVVSFVCPDSARVQAWQVVKALRARLPRNAIATCDVGAHKMLVGQVWHVYTSKTFFMANGLSAMGYAIPVATAACLAYPDRIVVAFLGDGGLGMYLGELETLTRLQLDLVLVVFVDSSLELIRRAQLRRGLSPKGTSFTNPDFRSLGRAFGIPVHVIEKPEDIDGALAAATTGKGVRLLAVSIDGDDYRI